MLLLQPQSLWLSLSESLSRSSGKLLSMCFPASFAVAVWGLGMRTHSVIHNIIAMVVGVGAMVVCAHVTAVLWLSQLLCHSGGTKMLCDA